MKSYLLILLFLLVTISTYSQVQLGIKTGVGLNTIERNDPYVNNEQNMTSLHAGIFSKIQLINRLNVIPELQYIVKGYEMDRSHGTPAYRLNINYLELPVLLNFRFSKVFSFEAGPGFAIKLKSRTVSASGISGYIDPALNSRRITHNIEVFDFGLLGGPRFNLTDRWILLLRYNYGLSSIEKMYYDPPGVPTGKQIKTYNLSAQISVAYQISSSSIHLKKKI